jgi:hypothetical protein
MSEISDRFPLLFEEEDKTSVYPCILHLSVLYLLWRQSSPSGITIATATKKADHWIFGVYRIDIFGADIVAEKEGLRTIEGALGAQVRRQSDVFIESVRAVRCYLVDGMATICCSRRFA